MIEESRKIKENKKKLAKEKERERKTREPT